MILASELDLVAEARPIFDTDHYEEVDGGGVAFLASCSEGTAGGDRNAYRETAAGKFHITQAAGSSSGSLDYKLATAKLKLELQLGQPARRPAIRCWGAFDRRPEGSLVAGIDPSTRKGEPSVAWVDDAAGRDRSLSLSG